MIATAMSLETSTRVPRDAAILFARTRTLLARLPLTDPRIPTVRAILACLRAACEGWEHNDPSARHHWDNACALSVRLCGRWND